MHVNKAFPYYEMLKIGIHTNQGGEQHMKQIGKWPRMSATALSECE